MQKRMKTWKNVKTSKKTEDKVKYIDRSTRFYQCILLISVLVLFSNSRNEVFDFSSIIIPCTCSSVKDPN